MDPLSIAASIVGLIGAAATISSSLTIIVKSVKGASKLVECVLLEVADIRLSLAQLQTYLSKPRANPRSRETLLLVDQITVTLATCVMTFSELEKLLVAIQTGRPLRPGTRVRWARKEPTIMMLLSRLRTSKASLSLMLMILSCTSFEEAQISVIQLTALVENILESNREMSQQLTQLKRCSSRNKIPDLSGPESVKQNEGPESDSTEIVHQTADTACSFEKDLLTSRVYTRAMIARSDLSLPLSTGNSTTVSLISGSSLADVSNIFALPLPIITEDIWNHRHYSAGKHASVETPKIDRNQHVSSSMTTMEHRVALTQFPSGSLHENGELSLSSKKVILLGVSLAGKTAVLKQLQNIYAGGFNSSDRTEARITILNTLVNAFHGAWIRMKYLQADFEDEADYLVKHFEVINYLRSGYQLNDFFCPDVLPAFRALWQHRGVRSTLTSNHWPGLDANIPSFMDNIYDLLNPDYILSDQDVIRGRIETTGLNSLSANIDGSQFKFLDVGGVRSERRKWDSHYEGVSLIIFIISLPGYYQCLVEDNNTTQMREALRTFESVTKAEPLKNTPIVLFLNKTDVFMNSLANIPISTYFEDFKGGSDYPQACEYFAQRFRKLDRRENGKLYFNLTNAGNIDSFKGTLRTLRLAGVKNNPASLPSC